MNAASVALGRALTRRRRRWPPWRLVYQALLLATCVAYVGADLLAALRGRWVYAPFSVCWLFLYLANRRLFKRCLRADAPLPPPTRGDWLSLLSMWLVLALIVVSP